MMEPGKDRDDSENTRLVKNGHALVAEHTPQS